MDSNVFGSGVPKMIVGSTTVTFSYSFIEEISQSPRDLEHESVLNAVRTYTQKTNYMLIDLSIVIRLHKYADPRGSYENIIQHHLVDVDELYPSATADCFRDENDDAVPFHFAGWEAFPLEKDPTWGYDTLRIYFKSTRPVRMQTSTRLLETGLRITDGEGNWLVDGEGDSLIDDN